MNPMSFVLWWELPLLVIGFISVVMGLGAMLWPWSGASRFWAVRKTDVKSPDFLQALSHAINTSITTGGKATLLNNGEQFFPQLLDDLRGAKASINFTTYIWEYGTISTQVLNILTEKARQGIQVRLLLDGFGSWGTPQKIFLPLIKAGGKMERFRTPKFGKLKYFHRRSHRRAIIIDGLIGYTGGMSISDKWQGNANQKHLWRDNMVRGTGPLATHIQSAFSQLWTATTGEVLVGDKYYPPHGNDGSELKSINLVSSPSVDAEPLPKFIWFSLTSAKKKIYITTPYLIPDRHIRKALSRAAKDGVDVKILLPGDYIDSVLVHRATQHYYRGLLLNGVKIYEYQPCMLHTKSMVIDGVWSIVGSANLDSRSLTLNEENVIGILDSQFAEDLEKTFGNDLKQAKQIKFHQWINRSWTQKAVETFASRFARQF